MHFKKLLVASSIFTLFLFPTSTVVAAYGVQTKTINCMADQALPDPACTPGAFLTTSTAIICVPGYTKTVRNVSFKVKKQVFVEYGIPYSKHSNYEVDHLISLELGGSNDVANLFPESYNLKYGAKIKDTFENYLHVQICKGKMTLDEAQAEISSDWLKYYLAWKGIKNATIPPMPSQNASNKNITSVDVTARCVDGTYYLKISHSGACSHHGGVALWYR